MDQNEFSNSIFKLLSNEGLIQSYRSQLRLGIHQITTKERAYSIEPFQHTVKSEIICNLIAEYLIKNNFGNSLSVFMEESAYHKMPKEEIIRNCNMKPCEESILEALVERKKRPYGYRTTDTQTEYQSLNDKFAYLEDIIINKKHIVKSAERKKMVNDRLAHIKKEKEMELESRINNCFESQKLFELSKAKIELSERYKTQIRRIKSEFEDLLNQKQAEIRLIGQHEEESTKLLEIELNRQLSRVRIPKESNYTSGIEDVERRCNAKVQKAAINVSKLIKKREKLKELLAQEKNAHKKSRESLYALQKQFATLSATK